MIKILAPRYSARVPGLVFPTQSSGGIIAVDPYENGTKQVLS